MGDWAEQVLGHLEEITTKKVKCLGNVLITKDIEWRRYTVPQQAQGRNMPSLIRDWVPYTLDGVKDPSSMGM